MIVASGSPRSLGGRPYLEEYFRVNGIKKEDLKSRSCDMVFICGDTKYKSEEIVEIPVKLEGNVPFLLGANTMVEWKVIINIFDETLEVYMYDKKNSVEFLAPKSGNHMKLHLGRLNQISSETKKKIEDELVQEEAEIERRRINRL